MNTEFKGDNNEWSISKNAPEQNEFGSYGLDIGFGKDVACVTLWLLSEKPSEKDLANAQLIATAPELLEVAIKCLDWCNNVKSPEFINNLRIETEKSIQKALNP